jgi:hypothetical protein
MTSDGFFFPLAGAVGRQRALHTKNSGFARATRPWHISTFRSYRILFSIRVLRLPPLILDKVRSYMKIISHDTLR